LIATALQLGLTKTSLLSPMMELRNRWFGRGACDHRGRVSVHPVEAEVPGVLAISPCRVGPFAFYAEGSYLLYAHHRALGPSVIMKTNSAVRHLKTTRPSVKQTETAPLPIVGADASARGCE